MNQPRYQYIASLLQAIQNCREHKNEEWEGRHTKTLMDHIKATIPSGSGMDCTSFDIVESAPNKLVFRVDYHHMDDAGYYTHWTGHTLTVRGSLLWGINIKISGKDENDVKEYIHYCFEMWLNEMVDVDGKTVEESNDAKTN